MATAGDISWHGPHGTFNLRVAAILTRGEEILLCTVEGLGYWFLPGGRVRFGEPAGAALARELAEEVGHEFPAGELALVVENIYGGERSSTRSGCTTTSPGPPRWTATICAAASRATCSAGHRPRNSARCGSNRPGW